MKRIFAGPTSLIVFTTLLIFILALHVTVSQAGENRGLEAKRKAFCQLMLRHGADAYARGQFEKAGYYFSQAVKADPAAIAKDWYKFKGVQPGETRLKDSAPAPAAKPEPPSKPVSTPKKEESSQGVIMGDDEGC